MKIYFVMSRDLSKPVYIDAQGLLTRSITHAHRYETPDEMEVAFSEAMETKPGGVENWIGQVLVEASDAPSGRGKSASA